MSIVDAEASSFAPLDAALVDRWLAHRNDVSSLAELWGRGVVVDTIEVSAPWSELTSLCEAILESLRALTGTVMASVHQSHAYGDGACLYFTFAGVSDDPLAYYRAAWDRVMPLAMACGAMSHHHGIGRNRARFVREALGASYSILEAIKSELDPLGILNPGVLALGDDPW